MSIVSAATYETRFQTWHRGNLVAPRTYPDWQNPDALRHYDAQTEAEYARNHLREIGLLLIGAAQRRGDKENGFANMSEALLVMALRTPFASHGFDVQFAPAELEKGDDALDDKGFDLTIARNEDGIDIPFLVLNAKLRALRLHQRADGHCYSQRAHAPYVSCSLGSWTTHTRDEKQIGYREWTERYVIPHVNRGGGIPHLPQFQRGVLARLESTVAHYHDKVQRIRQGLYVSPLDDRPLVPQNPQEWDDFEYKLATMARVLEELVYED